MHFKHLTLEERFWKKVSFNGPIPPHCPEIENCWVWTGAINSQGRPNFGVASYVTDLAHRVAWALVIGRIPEGMLVCHKCDNELCVRPSHLFLGTYLDNNRDRHSKGRDGDHTGENNGRAKLTEERVKEIRDLYTNGRLSQEAIARRFGIKQVAVSRIVRRVSWKCLE